MEPISWKIIKVKTKDLKEYEDNPRALTKKGLADLEASITKFGVADPPILNKDLTICGGHGRKVVLMKMGIDEVECKVCTRQLTPEEFKELNIRLNKNIAGEFDFDILANKFNLDDLLNWGFEERDFDLDEFDRYDESELDNAPEKRADVASQTGDLFIIEGADGRIHRLLCGDARDEDDLQNVTAGRTIDLFLTDPPYNVDYTGQTKDKLKIQNDKMKDGAFLKFLEDSFGNANKFLKKGGVFYIWHADTESLNFRTALRTVGLQPRQCLVWVKNNMKLGRQDYHWKHEPCLYGWKDGAVHHWNNDRCQTTILEHGLEMPKVKQDEVLTFKIKKGIETGWVVLETFTSTKSTAVASSILYFNMPLHNTEHPTMKPVSMFMYLIRNSTKKNNNVLDPFAGSGTTLIACEQTGRVANTVEQDPFYIDIILRRYRKLYPDAGIKCANRKFNFDKLFSE